MDQVVLSIATESPLLCSTNNIAIIENEFLKHNLLLKEWVGYDPSKKRING